MSISIPRLTDVTISRITEKAISPAYVRLAQMSLEAARKDAARLGQEGRFADQRVVLNSIEHVIAVA